MNIKAKAPFRQTPVINGQTSLKKPALKKLIKKLSALYPHCTPELWKEIFPPKCKIVMVKLTNKALIYYIKPKLLDDEPEPVETLPAFFSSTSKDKAPIFPTIFTMWKYPKLVMAYYIHHHICQYVFRGADLMLPGVSPSRSALQGVEMGSPRCVKVIGNPYPIAVGWAVATEKEIRANGMRGRGVKILHTYNDELHKMFKSMKPPNAGFKSKIVLPTEEDVKLTAAERAMLPPDWEATDKKLRKDAWQSSEEEDDDSGDFDDNSGEEKDKPGKGTGKNKRVLDVDAAPEDGSEAKPNEDEAAPQEEQSSESEESEEEEEKKENRVDKLKRVFEMTLLTITKHDLPLSGNDLIDRMREIDEDVDVKSTPWRKVGKFLKEMQKTKLVQSRDKKGKVSLIAVTWDHKLLIERKLLCLRNTRLKNCGIGERHLQKYISFLDGMLEGEEKPTAADITASYCKKFKRKGAIVGGPAVLLDYLFGGAAKVLALGPTQAVLKGLEEDKPRPEEVEIEKGDEVDDPNSQMLRAFYTAIKDKLKNRDLPILSSDFYLNFVRVCFPPGVTVNIKSTKWSTFTSFLKERAKTGVVSVKPQKDDGLVLVGINRGHPDYVNFSSNAEDLEPPAQDEEDKGDGTLKTFGSVIISQKFKPNGRLAPIFENVEEHQPNSLYSRQELRRHFVRWLKKHPEFIVPKDNTLFYVTPLLYRVIIKPKKEKNKAEGWRNGPKTIAQREAFARFDHECQQHSAVILGDNKPKWVYGPIPKINFMLEKRQGGNKHVTHITGLETYGVSPKEFAAACRKKFACATTNQKLPGSQQRGKQEVKIQGDLVYDLIEFLGNPATYNIPRKFTEIK